MAGRPWLGVVAAAVAATLLVVRVVARRRRWRQATSRARQVTIVPPPEVDPDGAVAWWANLAEVLHPSPWRRWWYGITHLGWEYRWSGRQLSIMVWVPGTVPASLVAAAARAAWPGATATIAVASAPLPARPPVAHGGSLAPVLPAWYPLRTDHDTDPLRPLLAAMAGLGDAERACVQVLARPAAPRLVRRLRRGVSSLRTGAPAGGLLDPSRWLSSLLGLLVPGPPSRATASGSRQVPGDPERDRDARAAVDKLALGQAWEVTIRYTVVHTNPRSVPPDRLHARVKTLAHAAASAFGVYTARQRLARHRLHHPATVLASRRMRHGFVVSVVELAGLATLPRDLAVPGLVRARAKPMPAPVEVPGGGRNRKLLGTAEVGGQAVALPVADARQHLHVLGATGSGKSNFLCNLVLDDIAAGRAVVVIDPKGDLVVDVLDRLPATVADRLVIIDPDQRNGARFNPLAGFDHDLVVDNIVAIFSQIFQRHWGPRIDDTLRVACLTLLRKANATLTLVPPLLNDKQFRAWFTDDLDDPEGLLGFWTWYEAMPAHIRSAVIGPVNARLRAFLLREFPRYTIGSPHGTFDMARLLDRRGILLARLPKGQLGEDTSRLMGSLILAATWQAATARTRMPEQQRRDATVVVDEAHNFLNLATSVDDMLAEARGYRLSLVLAHQHLQQLPKETQMALSANARNKLIFNVSPEDAKVLARHTLPELDEHDLSHLDAFQAAARLVIGNRETAAFTLATRPPRPADGEPTALRAAVASAAPPPPPPSAAEQRARRTGTTTLGHATDPHAARRSATAHRNHP